MDKIIANLKDAPKKHLLLKQIVDTFLISVFMTAVMCLGMRMIHDPKDPQFAKHLLADFITGCYVAIPAGYIIVPLVLRITNRLFH